MSSTTGKQKRKSMSKAEKGAKEGRQYEETFFFALIARAFELSKQENPVFPEFKICREIKIGKFDDVVLSYKDQDNSKKLIFFQLKHKQDYKLIDSRILSTENVRAKDIKGPYGQMFKDFNLQKYFISYLNIKDELEHTNTKELKDGIIKYVVIFTNMGLKREELVEKGFVLKKAPDDIVNLLTLEEPPMVTQDSDEYDFYQLEDVSKDLFNILKKSSDLDRVARELAYHAVCKNYGKNEIMGKSETAVERYQSGLKNYVIKTLNKVYTIKLPGKHKKKQKFREAQFKDEFLNSTAQNLQPLRNALFEAIREIDASKKGMNDDELKKDLKAAKWKIVPNFEVSGQNIKADFPFERMSIEDKDIKDFLQCFVFIVNQPGVTALDLLYKHSIQNVVAENISLKKLQDQTYAIGDDLKKFVKGSTIINPHNDKNWISSIPIEHFLEEKSQGVDIAFNVSAMTRIYKKEVMQYGKFDIRKKMENIDSFLTSTCKILCINTPVTLLSSAKLLQHLDAENNLISVNLNILTSPENRDYILKAFELRNISLIAIECRHAFKDHDISFLHQLVKIAEIKSNKKIILTMQDENYVIFTEQFKTNFQNGEIMSIENGSLDLKHFEPKENPFKKEVVNFQGQNKKVSLYDITGIDNWKSYVNNLTDERNECSLIDGMTLVQIFNNDEIEVGSKPAGMSSLEGAYDLTYKEINVENLVSKLTSQKHNDKNDMYIISGITEPCEQDKKEKLIQYLGLSNSKVIQDNLRLMASDSKIEISDDQFKDKDFRRLCHHYPHKRIFWISAKCENAVMKLILQESYNPKFYLKRKFRKFAIKKDLKEYLMKSDLSEIFIFHCAEDKQQFYKFMELNELETDQFENNHKIRVYSQKSDAETGFRELSERNEIVHLLEFEKQFFWCESHGSVKSLLKYADHKRSDLKKIDHEHSEVQLIEEDELLGKIKDRKVVIFADDPGMGKTTTLIKLYETESESPSIIKSNWVIGIKLIEHLEVVRQLKKHDIGIVNIVEFLSRIDLKLNNNLAKYLLKIAFNKNKDFQLKPLLLIFDGFDEILDEDCRERILLLLQFIKDKTAAKLWITTRCHFKPLLEETLSTIAIQFSPMDDAEKAQYIATYLQHRLHLTLNKKKYLELFDIDDKRQNNERIHRFTEAFISKMKSIFIGDIATFIGTPLQLFLMLEVAEKDFKKWIEEGEDNDFNYACQDVYEVYESFIYRKYDVYFQKVGIPEGIQREEEKKTLDEYHKDFAKSRILKLKQEISLGELLDKILLVGIIKSDGSNFQFIHKTFEEFFAAKVVIHWIEKIPNKFPNMNKQEYLISEILMKYDYQLIRIFMNLQLQKMTLQATHDKRLKYFGNIVKRIHDQEFLIDKYGKTPLYIAVEEGNKAIVHFLLNSLKGLPNILKDFLFTSVELDREYTNLPGTPLHLACISDDIEVVELLLNAAAGISEDTLQEFIKYLNDEHESAFTVAAKRGSNVKIFYELFKRTNNKLDLILIPKSALCIACSYRNQKFVEFLLEEVKNEYCLENSSLKKILLYNGENGNALCCADTTTIVEKLVSVAISMNDNNETLKNLLLPKKGELPFINAVIDGKINKIKKLLNVAKIDDDILRHLLLNEEHEESALHRAATSGNFHIMKLLLETACGLGTEILEELIFSENEEGENAIQLISEHGPETTFNDTFKMLKDEYPDIWRKVMETYNDIPLKRKLYWAKEKLIEAIERSDIQEVKNILTNAKTSSINPNERLSILLLSKSSLGNRTLHTACQKGNTEIIEELLSYAKEIDDNNHTLKRLFLLKRKRNSALHVAARCGHFDITKLLLEIASSLGFEILEELIFAVNKEGKNTIQLMAGHGHEKKFVESFKILEDKYPVIYKKVMEMYDNIPLEERLYWKKEKLIMAIRYGNIEEVKSVLSDAKNSSFNPNERLKILLLAEDMHGNSTLQVACIKVNIAMMKELLSCAMSMDDDGETLKELTKLTYVSSETQGLKHIIKEIVDDLVVEARNNNRDHTVKILEQFSNQYYEAESSFKKLGDTSKETIFEKRLPLPSFDFTSSSSEDSDSSSQNRRKIKVRIKEMYLI